jgi:hypothetical protein
MDITSKVGVDEARDNDVYHLARRDDDSREGGDLGTGAAGGGPIDAGPGRNGSKGWLIKRAPRSASGPVAAAAWAAQTDRMRMTESAPFGSRRIRYSLRFADGREASFQIGEEHLVEHLPEWTRLGFRQCANCPLSADQSPSCPMAVRLIGLVEATRNVTSHDIVRAEVELEGRTVQKTTTAQTAVSSLMGLLAATSACPRIQFLAPMARFHQPFATEKETIYRSVSTYLMSQFFIAQEGGTPDWELQGLRRGYAELEEVNRAMLRRMAAGCPSDGPLNALVVLDSLGRLLQLSLSDALAELVPLFRSVHPGGAGEGPSPRSG